ncbi:MAG: hypothetical protein AMXMBFR84_07040 [Candidatus Hydrogenedentota bacterium]
MEQRDKAPIWEAYRKIGDADRSFDVEFWQAQGTNAIMLAALQMVKDYEFYHKGNTGEFRLDRTLASFRKI